ncbi:MAG: hypothetical protein ACKOET_16980, partial [Verrucomicrobiota bacterium]
AEGVSEGRHPDGAADRRRFATLPSPGAPNQADADADGLADAWEVQQGLSPADPGDAGLDPDRDGMSNRAEFLAGTDPREAGSVLALVLRGTTPAGTAFSFLARAGHRYWIESADALPSTAWRRWLEIPPYAADREVRVGSPEAASAVRFYRLLAVPEPF